MYVQPFTPCQLRFSVLLFLEGWFLPAAVTAMALAMAERLHRMAGLFSDPAAVGTASSYAQARPFSGQSMLRQQVDDSVLSDSLSYEDGTANWNGGGGGGGEDSDEGEDDTREDDEDDDMHEHIAGTLAGTHLQHVSSNTTQDINTRMHSRTMGTYSPAVASAHGHHQNHQQDEDERVAAMFRQIQGGHSHPHASASSFSAVPVKVASGVASATGAGDEDGFAALFRNKAQKMAGGSGTDYHESPTLHYQSVTSQTRGGSGHFQGERLGEMI